MEGMNSEEKEKLKNDKLVHKKNFMYARLIAAVQQLRVKIEFFRSSAT